MKKITLVFLIISLTFLFSCGGGKTDGKKQVRLWHYFQEPDGPVFLKYIAEFNAMQDEIEIIAEFVPREELLKQYAMGLVAGELPDIGMIDNPDHASFSAAGLFEDITDRFNAWEGNNFLKGPLDSVTYNGRIYGLPQSSNCLALWYDIDMLEAAGIKPPETWDELMDAAKKLTKADVKGLAWSAVKNEEGTFQYLPWIISAGGTITKLNSPEGVKALEYLTKMVRNGYASKEVLVWGQGDVEKQFISGKAAMMINGPWIISSVRANAPEKNWSVVKIPMDKQYASVLGGENFVIIKGKEVDATWKFLSWFCGTEISERYNKDINKFSPKSDVDTDAMWASDEVMQVFAEQLSYAATRGPHPKWPEISSAIIGAVHESITGNKKPKDALDEAQKIVDSLSK